MAVLPPTRVARYCIRCGRARLEGAHFCTACGAAFDDSPLQTVSMLPVESELEPTTPYPIRLRLPYDARRSRLAAAFRLVLALPHLAGWIVVLAVAVPAALLAWIATLAGGRLPVLFHRFGTAVLTYVTRVAAYLTLATDRWPPFPGVPRRGYPVVVSVDPPARRSRLRTLLAPVLAIPAVVTAVLFGIAAWMLAVGAWFAILATGRMPQGIHEMLDVALGFQCRTLGYWPLLLTDVYPWFESGPLMLPSRRREEGDGAESPPPAASGSA
jgi:hypothetical protein